MSTVLRRNRKGSDSQIVRQNSIGLSLATIARNLNCHPTSVTLRLQGLNIPAADTRRSFMEDVYSALPNEFQETIADILLEDSTVKQRSIKDYVRDLLIRDVAARNKPIQTKVLALAGAIAIPVVKLCFSPEMLPAFMARAEVYSSIIGYNRGLLS